MTQERLVQIVDLAYERLRMKINGGRIRVENEASLQLHLGSILKTVGELYETSKDEHFAIELEKPVRLTDRTFDKSRTERAKIDIWCSFIDPTKASADACAIELKFFKRENHREPNNRYDVFVDIANLERYGQIATSCFLIVGTDHDHYVHQAAYSPDTSDFDFRHGSAYVAGATATYKTAKPYGPPVSLRRGYSFAWDTVAGGYHFLKLVVDPNRHGAPASVPPSERAR